MEIPKKVELTDIKLTEFSRGAGCGCKIAPQILREILAGASEMPQGNLLVGNSDHDDAAVYDLGNGTALISTTDFFMPIVDDAFSFGKIAAANAISDVYAMGGKPLMAIAILGWPIEKIPAAVAKEVLSGAREICKQSKIPMAGGHTIDSAEPFFGLAVNGIVSLNNLKKNSSAEEGDVLFLTKPIGIGILSTAQKRKVISNEDVNFLTTELCKLNSIGEQLGKIAEVSAMTDVTGFGLGGHLIEMAEGSDLTVEIDYSQLRIYENAKAYLKQNIFPDAVYRNWNSYGKKVQLGKQLNAVEAFALIGDPQTNGGLLIAVNPSGIEKVKSLLSENGYENFLQPVGFFKQKSEQPVEIK